MISPISSVGTHDTSPLVREETIFKTMTPRTDVPRAESFMPDVQDIVVRQMGSVATATARDAPSAFHELTPAMAWDAR